MATRPIPSENALHEDESTRERLLDSALKLFAEKGYDAASIREIIEGAGVTRPVLYYYFKNKEELFCELVEMRFAEMFDRLDDVLQTVTGCRERLKGIIRGEFASAEEAPLRVQFLLRYYFAPPDQPMRINSRLLAQERFARIVQIMNDGIDSGEIRGGDAPSLALAFAGFMDLHVMAKARRHESYLSVEHGDALVDLFFDGVTTTERTGRPLQYAFEEVNPGEAPTESEGTQ